MATGTAGGVGRQYHQQMIHYLRKSIVFGDDGSELSMGWVPLGAVVIRGGIVVSTAFNAGTTNVADLGTAADPDGFATDLALGTIGVIVADEMATTNDAGPYAADTEIKVTVDLTGTAATAGAGEAWVEFIPDNDQ